MHHWFKSNESCMRNGEAACLLQYIIRLICRASAGGLSADSYCSTLQKTSHLMYVLMVLSRWRKLLGSSSHFGRHCCHKQARDFQARIKTVIWHVWYRLDGRHKRMCVCVYYIKSKMSRRRCAFSAIGKQIVHPISDSLSLFEKWHKTTRNFIKHYFELSGLLSVQGVWSHIGGDWHIWQWDGALSFHIQKS